jgi:hypothetical protein
LSVGSDAELGLSLLHDLSHLVLHIVG